MHTSAIKTIADHLVATARAAGVHVTITTVSLQPPAMGNYDMLVDVRPAHPNSSAAVIVHASGRQELLQAERRQSVINDAAHLGWKACQRQVFALSEDFINRHPQTPTDYHRGVYHTAKQFGKTFSAFGPDDCDELRKALDAATPPKAATAEAAGKAPASVRTLPPLPALIPEGTPLGHAVREYARKSIDAAFSQKPETTPGEIEFDGSAAYEYHLDVLCRSAATPPTDTMVNAYLAAQRAIVEEADRFGRPNVGGLHTNTVREACRAGIAAAMAAQPRSTT